MICFKLNYCFKIKVLSQDTKYYITNLLGQQIKGGITENQSIDISSLPHGVYILTINNYNMKFIKG